MQQEHRTIIVSVNTEQDEDARMQQVNRQVGRGWRVVSMTPISGGDVGPGGNSDQFQRMQVILQRDIEPGGTIADGEKASDPRGDS
jgi:hypothetical protein